LFDFDFNNQSGQRNIISRQGISDNHNAKLKYWRLARGYNSIKTDICITIILSLRGHVILL